MESERGNPVPSSAADVFEAVGPHRGYVPSGDQGPDPAPAGDTDGSGGRTTRLTPPRALTVAVVTGLLLVVVLGAVGIVTHGRLDGATADLAATQARLTGAEAQLHVAQNELSAVRGQSATAGQALAKATSQLASAQSQLAKAQTDVSSQGVSISDLDTCLAGVEKALNQIALQDQAGAAVTLQGVAGNCRAAEPAST